MVCLATISLAALFTALLVATMVNNDWSRAKFIFFIALVALTLQQAACMLDGEVGGWLAFVVIVLGLVMLVLGHLGYFDTKEAKCPGPKLPPPPPPPPASASKCNDGRVPMCPDCPNVEYCPPPTFICGL